MANYTIRHVNSDGSIGVPLPDFVSIDLSPIFSKPGTIVFEYPENGTHADVLDEESEIAIFRSGVEIGELRCIVESVSGDDAAAEEDGKIWNYTARTNLALMERAVVYPNYWPINANPPGHAFFAVTPGEIMKTLVDLAQTRGALTGITLGFDEFIDSNGDAWSQILMINFAAGSNYMEVLDKLVEIGACETSMIGRELQLFNPGAMGEDKTTGSFPVIFAKGRDLKESPRTTSARDLRTTVLVAGENNKYVERTDPTAITLYGRREGFVSFNGVEDTGTLNSLGDTQLQTINRPKMEKTHGLIFYNNENSPEPIEDFNIGDWVLSDVGRGMESLRIKQWVVKIDSSGLVDGSVVLNDLFQETADYLNSRINDIVNGSVSLGGSKPDPPGTDTTIPKGPASLGAVSSTYQDNQGITYAQVTISWDPVTENVDNSPITDLSNYWVRWKYNSEAEFTLASWISNSQTTTYISGLLPNRAITIEVSAQDRNNNLSAWSSTGTTTAYDTNPPPKPSSPVVTAKLGQLFIAWDGKDFSNTAMPLDLELVQVHVSSGGSGFTPSASTLKDTILPGGGVSVVGDLTYGVQYWVKLVAQDYTGNLSSASDTTGSSTATFVQVVHTDLAGNIVDFTNITFKDIGNLIPDGSFELQSTADALNPLPYCDVVSGISGSPSPKVLRIDPWVQSPSANRVVATLNTDIPAAAGQKYTGIISYMATTGFANALTLNVRWKNAAGATISEEIIGGPLFTVADNTWRLRAGTPSGAAPAGTASMDIFINQLSNTTASTGFFYYDQLEVRPQVGTILIEDAAINNAKIANLAVNDAKISDLSVGKITAGTISTNWLIGAIIRTAVSGARVELKSTGLSAFNSGGVETVTISASTGNISAYGTFIAGAPSSNRIEITPNGGPLSSPAVIFKNPSASWTEDPIMMVETTTAALRVKSGKTATSSYSFLDLKKDNWSLEMASPSSSTFASSIRAAGGVTIESGNSQPVTLRAGSFAGGSSTAAINIHGKFGGNQADSMLQVLELIFTASAAGYGGVINFSWGPTLPSVPNVAAPGFWSDGRIITGAYKSMTTTGGSVEMWNLNGAGTAANTRCWIYGIVD